MNNKLIVLLATLKARRELVDAPLERNSDRAAYEILRMLSEGKQPTITEVVDYIEKHPAGPGPRTLPFDRAAWMSMTTRVAEALKAVDPTNAIRGVWMMEQ